MRTHTHTHARAHVQTLVLPASVQAEVDLQSILVRSKPFSDAGMDAQFAFMEVGALALERKKERKTTPHIGPCI